MKAFDKVVLMAGVLAVTTAANAAAPTNVTPGTAIASTATGLNYELTTADCGFLANNIEFGLSANVAGGVACTTAAGIAVATANYKGRGRAYSLNTAGGNSVLETAAASKYADAATAATAAQTAANTSNSSASY